MSTEAMGGDGTDHQDANVDQPRWPPYGRFPYNCLKKDGGPRAAGTIIEDDLQRSDKVLIVTGFTSLPHIISFLAKRQANADSTEPIRILIGYDPTTRNIKKSPIFIGKDAVVEEIRDYWLREKLSVYQSRDVVCAREMLKNGRVIARTSRDKHRLVHAKIFKSDDVITFGSSNFSKSGLKEQVEMNLRLLRSESEYTDIFVSISQYAEKIWEISREYTMDLYELLKHLCHEVTWQEALARGCAELLRGKWAKRYTEYAGFGESPHLWPFQEQGVLQALYIVETFGNVLIADATGSGKTWMGAALIRSILQRIWSNPARLRNDIPVLLVPPKIIDDWQNIANTFSISPAVFSHGDMSNPQSNNHKRLTKIIPRAQILAVDEAHNFLNRHSRRSQLLTRNMADHVILFTATPINREPSDLFRMVTLLGPDNFDDDVLDVLERMIGGRKRRKRGVGYFTEEERKVLQNAIQQFTLRRTKSMLNQMIQAQPDLYIRGERYCRYPNHQTFTYACEGTSEDRRIAQEIFTIAQGLKGLIWLTVIKKSPNILLADQQYLDQRLRGAQGLALYQVMDCLRSSRAALLEHICGTDMALRESNILDKQSKIQKTGAMMKKLANIVNKLPEIDLNDVLLPEWLHKLESYEATCRDEVARYARIAQLAKGLSSAREKVKAQTIVSILQKHNIILAFDRHIITLYDLQNHIGALPDVEVVVVTGESVAQARRIQKNLRPNDKIDEIDQKMIVLCSDALSEGVNLQKASVVINLDMPTVIRRAEQRIGRVDRIDSPHESIESWWPNDSAEFLPRTYERLFERHLFVHDVIGSNILLPLELYTDQQPSKQTVSSEDIIRELNDEQKLAESQDPFAAIRDLVIGQHAIIPKEVYSDICNQTAQIRTAVSIVHSEIPWAFVVLEGVNGSAPRFIFLDDKNPILTTKLDDIAVSLRARLHTNTPPRHLDTYEMSYLQKFVERIAQSECLLLSKKKQRALAEMGIILKSYLKINQYSSTVSFTDGQIPEQEGSKSISGEEDNTSEREQIIHMLLGCIDGSFRQNHGDSWVIADMNVLAELWLDLIRPVWYEYLSKPGRTRKLVRLRDIRPILEEQPLKTEELRQLLEKETLWISPVDERVVAVIVGVPDPG